MDNKISLETIFALHIKEVIKTRALLEAYIKATVSEDVDKRITEIFEESYPKMCANFSKKIHSKDDHETSSHDSSEE
jgi:hypothetical protein